MKLVKTNTHNIIEEGVIIGNVCNNTRRITSQGFVFGIVMPNCIYGVEVNNRVVRPGEFFCRNTPVYIDAMESSVTYFIQPDKTGNEIVAGKIGLTGNQRYIDGCTDSLLVCPSKLGEPCLNALYFPHSTEQTYHTHPSLRCGIVLRGSGVADTAKGTVALCVGDIWFINSNERHRFRTFDEELVVVAYHPDSDWGPTDEKHPMVNRTVIDDIELAEEIAKIRLFNLA